MSNRISIQALNKMSPFVIFPLNLTEWFVFENNQLVAIVQKNLKRGVYFDIVGVMARIKKLFKAFPNFIFKPGGLPNGLALKYWDGKDINWK